MRRRHPPDGPAVRELAVEVRRLDAQGAEVVADDEVVPESGQDLALGPDSIGEVGAEVLVGQNPVGGQPEGMRALDRTGAGKTVEASVQAELPAELVAKDAEDRLLVGRADR